MQKFQVALLGLNSIFGRCSSIFLKQSNIIKKLALYDDDNIDSAKDISIINTSCEVEAFLGKENLNKAVKDADVIIIGDGNLSTPHTSFDLMAPKVCDYAKAIASSSPNAIVVVAASPVNILVPLLSEVLIECGTYDCNKIIGATAVDNVRANCILASHLCVNPQKVILPVIGGASKHTRVPLISQAKPSMSISIDTMVKLVTDIRKADECVFSLKKSPEALNKAYSTFQFLKSIFSGLQGEPHSMSIAFTKTSLVPQVNYFSLPIKLGRYGIQKTYGIPGINPFEEELLYNSIQSLKMDIEQAGLFLKSKDSFLDISSLSIDRNTDNSKHKESVSLKSFNTVKTIDRFPNDSKLDTSEPSHEKMAEALEKSFCEYLSTESLKNTSKSDGLNYACDKVNTMIPSNEFEHLKSSDSNGTVNLAQTGESLINPYELSDSNNVKPLQKSFSDHPSKEILMCNNDNVKLKNSSNDKSFISSNESLNLKNNNAVSNTKNDAQSESSLSVACEDNYHNSCPKPLENLKEVSFNHKNQMYTSGPRVITKNLGQLSGYFSSLAEGKKEKNDRPFKLLEATNVSKHVYQNPFKYSDKRVRNKFDVLLLEAESKPSENKNEIQFYSKNTHNSLNSHNFEINQNKKDICLPLLKKNKILEKLMKTVVDKRIKEEINQNYLNEKRIQIELTNKIKQCPKSKLTDLLKMDKVLSEGKWVPSLKQHTNQLLHEGGGTKMAEHLHRFPEKVTTSLHSPISKEKSFVRKAIEYKSSPFKIQRAVNKSNIHSQKCLSTSMNSNDEKKYILPSRNDSAEKCKNELKHILVKKPGHHEAVMCKEDIDMGFTAKKTPVINYKPDYNFSVNEKVLSTVPEASRDQGEKHLLPCPKKNQKLNNSGDRNLAEKALFYLKCRNQIFKKIYSKTEHPPIESKQNNDGPVNNLLDSILDDIQCSDNFEEKYLADEINKTQVLPIPFDESQGKDLVLYNERLPTEELRMLGNQIPCSNVTTKSDIPIGYQLDSSIENYPEPCKEASLGYTSVQNISRENQEVGNNTSINHQVINKDAPENNTDSSFSLLSRNVNNEVLNENSKTNSFNDPEECCSGRYNKSLCKENKEVLCDSLGKEAKSPDSPTLQHETPVSNQRKDHLNETKAHQSNIIDKSCLSKYKDLPKLTSCKSKISFSRSVGNSIQTFTLKKTLLPNIRGFETKPNISGKKNQTINHRSIENHELFSKSRDKSSKNKQKIHEERRNTYFLNETLVEPSIFKMAMSLQRNNKVKKENISYINYIKSSHPSDISFMHNKISSEAKGKSKKYNIKKKGPSLTHSNYIDISMELNPLLVDRKIRVKSDKVRQCNRVAQYSTSSTVRRKSHSHLITEKIKSLKKNMISSQVSSGKRKINQAENKTLLKMLNRNFGKKIAQPQHLTTQNNFKNSVPYPKNTLKHTKFTSKDKFLLIDNSNLSPSGRRDTKSIKSVYNKRSEEKETENPPLAQQTNKYGHLLEKNNSKKSFNKDNYCKGPPKTIKTMQRNVLWTKLSNSFSLTDESTCSYIFRRNIVNEKRLYHTKNVNGVKYNCENHVNQTESKILEKFIASRPLENLYRIYTKNSSKIEYSRGQQLPSINFLQRRSN